MSLILPNTAKTQLNITTLHGKVVIQLDRPVTEIVLEPQQAAQVSKALADATADLIRKGPKDYSLQ